MLTFLMLVPWPAVMVDSAAVLLEEAQGEFGIKAAYLFNFAKFIRWPEKAFARPEDPLVMGVLGQDELSRELERVIGARTVQGRRVLVKRLRTAEEAAGCHVLFLGEGESARIAPTLRQAGRGPLLTVGDVRGFCRMGGMIGFVWDGDRIRFEINPEAMERAGLAANSQLLMVAKALTRTAIP